LTARTHREPYSRRAAGTASFKRESHTARSVVEIFDRLHGIWEKEEFMMLFQLCLPANGSKFPSPTALETDPGGECGTCVFCANPDAPGQKDACENNHSLMRRVIPKGTSFFTVRRFLRSWESCASKPMTAC
jgi:IS30 family transposase